MIHIPSTIEFLNRTAIILDFEFEDINLIPNSPAGMFDNHRLEELKRFCVQNPVYHIVSVVNAGLYFNKPIPDAQTFYLAEGDSNPDLVCFESYRLARYIASLKTRP